MKEWFLASDYSQIVLKNQIDQVVFGRDESVKKTLESGIPFFTTCRHPKVKELGKLTRDLLPFLYSNEEVQKVFSTPSMVSYRSARNMKDYTRRSGLHPVERKVGCPAYGNSRCQVFKSINITDDLTSFTTKKTY